MKTMKRFLAGMVAVASVMAIAPMSAFATDDTKIEQDSTNKTGGMVVRYLKSAVSPTYTITIPATVDLNAENPTATIKAEDVYLDITKHKQINVTLDSAQYVETGASEFIAKTTDGNSQVTYTIGKGTATTGVKVGDTVAEFTADSSQVLSFSAPTGATYAGEHTETLTFGISVEDAVSVTYKIIGNVMNPPRSSPANFTEVTLEEATAYGQSFTGTAAWLIIYAKDGSNYKFVCDSPDVALRNGTQTWENIVMGEAGIYQYPEQVSIIAPVTE